MKRINLLITQGAVTFLKQEYTYLSLYCILFSVVLALTVDQIGEKVDDPHYGTTFPYTASAFLVGAFTSIVAGGVGMRIAVYTNVRTTYECATKGIHEGFVTAFRGGQVLGFMLVGLAILIL